MVRKIEFVTGGISKKGTPYCWIYSLEPVKNGYGFYPVKSFYEGSLAGVQFPSMADIEYNERGSVANLTILPDDKKIDKK